MDAVFGFCALVALLLIIAAIIDLRPRRSGGIRYLPVPPKSEDPTPNLFKQRRELPDPPLDPDLIFKPGRDATSFHIEPRPEPLERKDHDR